MTIMPSEKPDASDSAPRNLGRAEATIFGSEHRHSRMASKSCGISADRTSTRGVLVFGSDEFFVVAAEERLKLLDGSTAARPTVKRNRICESGVILFDYFVQKQIKLWSSLSEVKDRSDRRKELAFVERYERSFCLKIIFNLAHWHQFSVASTWNKQSRVTSCVQAPPRPRKVPGRTKASVCKSDDNPSASYPWYALSYSK